MEEKELNEKTPNQKSILNFIEGNEQKLSFINIKREQNKKVKSIVDVPRPFLKWAGGKRQLISQINPFFPKDYNKYIEPFVGGGAIFFYLLPKNAILIDINEDLINTYNIIKNNVSELIELLKKYKNEKRILL